MTTPLTTDEERKLAEAVFKDNIVYFSGSVYVIDRFSSSGQLHIEIDYAGNQNHRMRLVEFICDHIYSDDKATTRINRIKVTDAIRLRDTESLKRMALELIP